MNLLKTGILLVLLSSILLFIGGIIGGEVGIILALVFALGINFGAYWYSDKIALGMTHAVPVTELSDPELYRIVKVKAHQFGIPIPKLYEIDDESPNAFATGRNPEHGTIAVTNGLRNILNKDELGAVIAHELAHIGNRDTLIMTIVATIAGAVSMLAMIAQFSAIFGGMSNERERGNGVLGLIIAAVVMPLVAMIIRMAISRTREYQADQTAASHAGQAELLASALIKLQAASRNHPLHVNEAVSHLFIVNPLSGKAMSSLFSTHPPIEDRVRRLRELT